MSSRADDLSAWRVFVTYAKTGSLVAAADVLDVEPSSVSRTIRSLERAIGQALVQHNSRPMQLTEAGQKALSRMEPVLRTHQKLIESLQTDAAATAGHIRLSVAPGFASRRIMPFLTAFKALYFNIDIDIVTGMKEPDMAKGLCEVGVLTGEPTLPGLVYMYRGRNVYLPVASPAYIARHGMPLGPIDLVKHTVYAYQGPVRPETKFLERGEIREAPVYDRVVRMADITTIRQALLADQGVGVDMPLVQIYEDLTAGRLVPVMPGWMRKPEECYVVTSRANWHIRRVRLFMQWFANRMHEAFDGYEKAVSSIVGLPPKSQISSDEVFQTKR